MVATEIDLQPEGPWVHLNPATIYAIVLKKSPLCWYNYGQLKVILFIGWGQDADNIMGHCKKKYVATVCLLQMETWLTTDPF